MASLGEAFINVRADLKPFTKDLAEELGVILNQVEKEVQRRGRAIGRTLSDSMAKGAKDNAKKIGDTINREVAKTKITIKTEVDEDATVNQARGMFSRLGILARSAATSIAKRFSDTFVSLGRFISGTFGRVFGGLGGAGRGGGGAAFAAVIAVVGAALASLIPIAVQAVQALGALAATLAILPGAGAAVAVSMGILTLAFQGFDKAIEAALEGDMEAFNEALKDLSPSARSAARAMQPFLTMLQDLVQENFFRTATPGIRAFFKAINTPGIRGDIEGIASQLGGIVNEFFRWAASGDGMMIIGTVLDNISETLTILRPAIRPLAQALGTVIRAGSSVLPTVANVVVRLAESFAKFIEDADRSGALATFFTNIGLVFEKLGPVLEQAVGLLLEFLNWAVANPDVITSIATAFFTFAEAIGEAFSDPVVIANMKTILGIFASIPPETWNSLAIAITAAATALGALGAALIALSLLTSPVLAIIDYLRRIRGSVDETKTKLTNAAAGFKEAGKKLMQALFDGMKSAVGSVGNVANAIVSRIKAGINSAIGSINSRLDSAFSIFNVNFPNIPFLAKGGILDQPTLAMIAEKGPEAVIPLNDPARAAAIMMKSGLANMMAPIVNVFLGTEQLEARMYQVVARNNTAQAGSLNRGPRVA